MSDTPDRKDTALIPSGSTALTTRSSALVKRGLETLASLRGRIVQFPTERSMGKVTLYDPVKNVFQELGEARGDVAVPPGMKLYLSVSDEAVFDLSPLALLRPDDVQHLFISHDEVFDEDLEHIKHLKFLEDLSLSGQFTDAGLEHLGKLTGLRYLMLFLHKSHITDAELAFLNNLSELEVLSLYCYGAISNVGFARIATLKKLGHLDLAGSVINGVGLSYLHQLPFLFSLVLSYVDISDADIAQYIQGLTILRALWLDGTRITDNGLKCLRSLTNLRDLNLARCKISDSGLVHLQNLRTLESLNLSDTDVSEEAINSLQDALPNCRIIKREGKE